MKLNLPKWRWPLASPLRLTQLSKRARSAKSGLKKRLSWRTVGKWLLIFVGACVLVVVFLFAWFAKDLPTPGKIKNLTASASTRLYDRNNQPLYTISGEKKRIIVEAKDIPEVVRQATVAIEDKRFYNHPGLDLKGIARSLVVDALQGGSSQGGSTITQQYVKNALLTSEKKLVRKIKEAILAIEIEALYSKEEILTLYLNEIPYGGNNYGIEAAARTFYNKSAKDLTLVEAATLAALPQAPSTLSPYGTHTDRLIARRNATLDVMTELGYITKEAADEAKKVELTVAAKHESIVAPHFVLYVKEWLVKYFTEQLGDEQLAEQKVEEGGLNVVTTLDLEQQKIAEEVVSKAAGGNLARAKASNAGLVSIDPKRGEVRAMVGSVDYFNQDFGAFNIATAKRQPGSSFKPVVYAASFKDKYNPAYNLFDLRTDFGNYEPDNFDGGFRGPVSIRYALGNSLNIPAVKILALVGLDSALKTASDMGITTLTDKDRYGLSLVLGGGEVELIELTTAYGVFANNGTLMPTTPILKITDSGGKDVYNHEDPKDGRQVLDPQIAYQITNILADVEAKKPTFSRVMNVLTLPGRPSAVKTGTTNAFRDAWTIGYTPQYVTGVWAGNNDNSSMNNAGGSVAAAPIWDEYMTRIHEKLPAEQFNRPEGIEEITVDKLSNKLPVEGSDAIKDIFARWQIPKDKDDAHVRVRVCKENGLLADNSIPDELAEERVYYNIRSEQPNNPAWENPVRAWAEKNGFSSKAPTERCVVSSETQPTVTITSPTDGGTVTGTFNFTANAVATTGVKYVELSVDGTSIAVDTDSPYATTYNAANLADGSHTLKATVVSTSGAAAAHSITVISANDVTPPNELSSYTGIAGPGPKKATLTWTNPTNSDFAGVRIYIYRDNTSQLLSTVTVAAPGTSTTVTGLDTGVAYRFTARTFDITGNESAGTSVVLTPI